MFDIFMYKHCEITTTIKFTYSSSFIISLIHLCVCLLRRYNLLSTLLVNIKHTVCVCLLNSHIPLFVTPWAVAHQVPLSMKFSGKNTRVGCHSLLQGISPTQGSNPGLLHWERILYQLSYQGSLYTKPILQQSAKYLI